ncbi:ParA family protein (plasmid) [Borrelia miyamotoi]|uniref:ParA family protein n=1 Tax=Borrelia miyamotoi TaxID=47466 RepID=A0A5P8AUU4_9SPIR|nr:ParA family protein [Borrelia miyamotoi]ATQ19029.1 ParA family protein [Borrelia miyamotoi]QFP42494.1 ParA family protein [Borrelia miyamotoi]WAZ71382.1 ParA family protein [Borrelia miyamotoi]WAZ72600.1 ParA family protein [Borrelia miyamotoi]WVI05485.1 ParA family protein [Borrelia miyamotoi]
MDRKKTEIITIASIKGGVGKSTSALFFSNVLSHESYKVLLIDSDPQASLTSYFLFKLQEQNVDIERFNLYEILKQRKYIENCIFNVSNYIDIIPSSLELSSFNSESIPLQDNLLEKRLLAVKSKYDYIIIDTNPSLGHLLNNALIIADYLVIPINSDLWAVESIDLIVDATKKVYREDLLPNFLVTGALERQSIDKEVISELENRYRDNLIGIIPKRDDIKKTVFYRKEFSCNTDYYQEYKKSLSNLLKR